MNRLFLCFPGKVPNTNHMGKELFKENTVFRQSMLEMDAIASTANRHIHC
ncbi:polyketide synthase [Bacillus subtilis]|nr:polyketide synthase [Bacillus subtilis]